MRQQRTLIKNAFVVSVDERIGNIDGCDLLIDGSELREVRPGIAAGDAEVIDGTGMIATPGLIDTHHHLWQGALRSVTTDWSLQDYVNGIRMFAASYFRPEDMYATSLQGALEKLHAGVTTVADYCHNINTPDHGREAVRGLKDSGARIIWGFGFNRPPLEEIYFNTMAKRADYLRGLASEEFTSGDALVTLGVCPEELLFWNTPDYGVPQFEIARELNARIFLHANSALDMLSQESPLDVQKLVELGLLGPDVLLVHMGSSEPQEWAMVADAGAAVSFTPETELQMSMGWPKIDEVRAHGIPFGFGIDIVSNNSADLRFPLRMMLQLERHRINEPKVGHAIAGVPVSSAEVLYWGTLGAAKALGLDSRIGSLTPGKQADLILHDGHHITLAGWNRANPESVVLAQAGAESVDSVWVGGRAVKRKGELCGAVSANHACQLLIETSDYVHHRARDDGGFNQALAGSFEKLAAQKAEGN